MGRRKSELTAKIVQKASVGVNKKQIADDLGITPVTVRNHLRPLREELNERVKNGEDPSEAWENILISVLLSAGTVSTILAEIKAIDVWMKTFDKVCKAGEESGRRF